MRVAELLVLRDDMPRSLHSCMNEIHAILQRSRRDDREEPERLAGEMHAQLHYGRLDGRIIMQPGLHEYLTEIPRTASASSPSEVNRLLLPPSAVAPRGLTPGGAGLK